MFLIKIKIFLLIILLFLFIILFLYILFKNRDYYHICSNLPFIDKELRKNDE